MIDRELDLERAIRARTPTSGVRSGIPGLNRLNVRVILQGHAKSLPLQV